MEKLNVPLTIYLSNVQGLGATRLASSIVSAFITISNSLHFYIPENFPNIKLIEKYKVNLVKRFLPNNISRFIEVFKYHKFNYPVINFTDLPLKSNKPQLLFLQNPHFFKCSITASSLKSRIIRYLISRNLDFVDIVVVQTENMKERFLATYNFESNNVHVLAQPAPTVVQKDSNSKIVLKQICGIRCFYPAAVYPHKNHKLLSKIPESFFLAGNSISLTCKHEDLPFLKSHYFEFLGRLNLIEINNVYKESGVLLFPSLDESYGLPLIEAMIRKLPIVVPNLPYAKSVCGKSAFYFDINSSQSFLSAINNAVHHATNKKLIDYSKELSVIPKDWVEVADKLTYLMLKYCNHK